MGDFNRDGNLDIVAGTGTLDIFLGNGDGTFRAGATYSQGAVSLAVGDLNGDGILDIVDGYGTSLYIFLGNGDGTFSESGPTYPMDTGSMHIADMNGDGIPDLVFDGAGSITLATLGMMLGNGDGTFQTELLFPVGKEIAGIAVADFNGDHQPDVVVTTYDGNSVVSLLNTGVVKFFPSAPPTFLEQLVGTTSPPQTVRLTNTGSTTLSITSMTVAGQFGMTSTCGTTVAPGANCSITVSFSPQSVGNKTGTVAIVDSASSKPQVIELTGTATVVSFSPTALNFGNRKVGSRITLPLQMTNQGTTPITIASISTDSFEYFETNSCGTQLGAGASCGIEVTFAPTQKGDANGTLSISDSGGGSPQTIMLTGSARNQ